MMTYPELYLAHHAPFGVGLGLRGELFAETLAASANIDWLEITPENYMGRGGLAQARLDQAKSVYPIISHGVSLSLGSVDPLNEDYLIQLEALFEQIDPPWFSDHLSFSSIQGAYSNDLIPLPRTDEALQHVVQRIRHLQNRFQRPFLIENISYYLEYPESEMSEAQFLSRIVEQSECGLLLDVNNVYVNAQNHQWDPYHFLEQLPLDQVVEIHIAGHQQYDEGLIDTHGEAICEDVWALFDWLMRRSRPWGVLLERDLNIPPFAELLRELARIRGIWNATQRLPHKNTQAELIY